MSSKPHRQVIILRGPSGCGKSTWAKGLQKASNDNVMFHIVSADDYFVKRVETIQDGEEYVSWEYRFDPRELPIAHAFCFNQFLKHLRTEGDCIIVVDNTNIHRWELENYSEAADLAGFEVVERSFVTESTPISEIREWAERSSHGVPPEVVARMALEFEE